MCSLGTLTHHAHAAETTLPLTTVVPVVHATATLNMAKSRTKVGNFGKNVINFHVSNLPNLISHISLYITCYVNLRMFATIFIKTELTSVMGIVVNGNVCKDDSISSLQRHCISYIKT